MVWARVKRYEITLITNQKHVLDSECILKICQRDSTRHSFSVWIKTEESRIIQVVLTGVVEGLVLRF